VILVIDARGMTRGVAPLILGYQRFDRDVRIAGAILNNLGGSRHEAKLRAVIEHYTDVRCWGRSLRPAPRHRRAPARADAEQRGRRHRRAGRHDRRDRRGRSISPACCRSPPTRRRWVLPAKRWPTPFPGGEVGRRIGIAQDRAFGFYYADDLDALRAAGATLVAFDTLNDAVLPDVDGLFIGGGFRRTSPPTGGERAAARDDPHRDRAGLPVYAECGGLMYLAARWSATALVRDGRALPRTS